ncbi:hypothetical protein CWO92_10350 [Heyndrickxia camelliae]|uniref:Uncharacterized protein n=1 Tax=Heyndrickxia camelliae TaxID=1707093 RepID=A0A2N3LKI7_9BACI|nr:hypothetical protein CWO92_10350 [Heyndrickxia camelliae]
MVKSTKAKTHEIKVFKFDFMRFFDFHCVLSQPLFIRLYMQENRVNLTGITEKCIGKKDYQIKTPNKRVHTRYHLTPFLDILIKQSVPRKRDLFFMY